MMSLLVRPARTPSPFPGAGGVGDVPGSLDSLTGPGRFVRLDDSEDPWTLGVPVGRAGAGRSAGAGGVVRSARG
jgi:hypothetical protein